MGNVEPKMARMVMVMRGRLSMEGLFTVRLG